MSIGEYAIAKALDGAPQGISWAGAADPNNPTAEEAQVVLDHVAAMEDPANNPLRFAHSGRFFIATDDVIVRANGIANAVTLGMDVTGQGFRDEDGVRYDFTSNADFTAWFFAGMQAVNVATFG